MSRRNLINKLRNIYERHTLKAVIIIITAGMIIFSENMPANAKEYDIVIMNGRAIDFAVTHPITLIASDGRMSNGRGQPWGTGTFSRALGVYVREKKILTLMDALRKMTLMPAIRFEQRVPTMIING